MTILQSIILGIIQGIGEFLPISSSAHLIAIPWILKWPQHTLAFDVALHVGTLLAVLSFFWRDWIKLIKGGIVTGLKTHEGKMFWFIVVASIPGAIIGKLLEEQAETTFRSGSIMPLLIASTMAGMGLILFLADKFGKKEDDFSKINFIQSFLIGCSQALAIIPGVSRSGITMTTGRFLGLNRESAAKFSFLLSTPIIAGSALLKFKDITHGAIGSPSFLIGMVTSAITGFLCIGFLLKYLKKSNFNIFVIYRLCFAALLVILFFVRK